jgi:excisionase family DNA binding protein
MSKNDRVTVIGAEEFSSVEIFDKLKWMNSEEAASYIRVSAGQLRNMVWRGQLKAYRLGKARLRFLRADLDKAITHPEWSK